MFIIAVVVALTALGFQWQFLHRPAESAGIGFGKVAQFVKDCWDGAVEGWKEGDEED